MHRYVFVKPIVSRLSINKYMYIPDGYNENDQLKNKLASFKNTPML